MNSLQLKSRFYSLKKENEDSMGEHINKMTKLLEELRALGINIPEEDSVMVLLNSIPDTYQMVKVALRTHEGLTLDKVAARLREAEMELEPMKKSKESGGESAFVSNNKSTMKNSAHNKEKTCFKCQKVGHIARNCRNENSGKFTCFKCGKPGHKAPECKSGSKQNALIVGSIKSGGYGSKMGRTGDPWIIDSGASQHLCHKKGRFH